eukprot:8683430-Lingulodinium_polyedra.AAC.3
MGPPCRGARQEGARQGAQSRLSQDPCPRSLGSPWRGAPAPCPSPAPAKVRLATCARPTAPWHRETREPAARQRSRPR